MRRVAGRSLSLCFTLPCVCIANTSPLYLYIFVRLYIHNGFFFHLFAKKFAKHCFSNIYKFLFLFNNESIIVFITNFFNWKTCMREKCINTLQ